MYSDTELALFQSPIKSEEDVPPYKIHIEFSQYRRNREYTGRCCVFQLLIRFSCSLVHLHTSQYFDSFLVQARGEEKADGNATLVGWFVNIPHIGKDLHCMGKRKSRYSDD